MQNTRVPMMRVRPTVVAERITGQYIWAATTMATGALIAITGPDVGDRARWFAQLLGWPVGAGIAFFLAGVLMLVGRLRSSARLSITGLWASAVLYAGFSFGFVLQWRVFVLEPKGDPPFVYPFAVYLGIAVWHAMLADSLTRERRQTRDGKAAEDGPT